MLRALALAPDNLVVCGELAAFYRRLGRVADARTVQRRMVDLQPENAVHYVNLASLASQLGDYPAAEAALKEVIGKRPDLSIGYSGLAQLYLQAGKLEQARWFAEAALRMEPAAPEETVQTYRVLATVCRRLGDQAAAETALAEVQKRASAQTRPPHANLPPGDAAGVRRQPTARETAMTKRHGRWAGGMLVLSLLFSSAHAASPPTCSIRIADATLPSGIAFRAFPRRLRQAVHRRVHGRRTGNVRLRRRRPGRHLLSQRAPLRGTIVPRRPGNALYRNNGDWTFTDVTEPAGVGDTGYGLGMAVGGLR